MEAMDTAHSCFSEWLIALRMRTVRHVSCGERAGRQTAWKASANDSVLLINRSSRPAAIATRIRASRPNVTIVRRTRCVALSGSGNCEEVVDLSSRAYRCDKCE